MTTIKPASIVNPVTPIGYNGSIYVPFIVDSYSGDNGALRTSLPIDRGGTLQILYFVGNYGNHTETVRATYTVPSGKYALLNNIYMSVTKPSTSGNVWTKIQVNSKPIGISFIESTTNNADCIKFGNVNLLLPSNSTVSILTSNTTTSSVYFEGVAFIIEFNP
jgi:hypothetical protein